MDTQTEKKLDDAIRAEMKRLRDASIVTGMRAALGAVLGIIRDKRIKSSVQKLKRIEQFCVQGINNRKEQSGGDKNDEEAGTT